MNWRRRRTTKEKDIFYWLLEGMHPYLWSMRDVRSLHGSMMALNMQFESVLRGGSNIQQHPYSHLHTMCQHRSKTVGQNTEGFSEFRGRFSTYTKPKWMWFFLRKNVAVKLAKVFRTSQKPSDIINKIVISIKIISGSFGGVLR